MGRSIINGLPAAVYHRQYRVENRSRLNTLANKRNAAPKERRKRKIRAHRWYLANRKAIIGKKRHQDETLPGKIRRWKDSAKRRGIGWSLTEEFIIGLPLVCHYTGWPLTLKIGQLNTFSIDRVCSDGPYAEDNVVPCCAAINKMKLDYSAQDFIRVCNAVAEFSNCL